MLWYFEEDFAIAVLFLFCDFFIIFMCLFLQMVPMLLIGAGYATLKRVVCYFEEGGVVFFEEGGMVL